MKGNDDVLAQVDSKDRRPRLRVIQQSRDAYLGPYKGCLVDVCRERRYDNWYIVVTAEDGGRIYDGWWPNSAYKTKREAILESLRGAMLWPPNS